MNSWIWRQKAKTWMSCPQMTRHVTLAVPLASVFLSHISSNNAKDTSLQYSLQSIPIFENLLRHWYCTQSLCPVYLPSIHRINHVVSLELLPSVRLELRDFYLTKDRRLPWAQSLGRVGFTFLLLAGLDETFWEPGSDLKSFLWWDRSRKVNKVSVTTRTLDSSICPSSHFF